MPSLVDLVAVLVVIMVTFVVMDDGIDARYKMFVAKGREFKFFGDDFKCPECGAGKNKFTEADMDDDLL